MNSPNDEFDYLQQSSCDQPNVSVESLNHCYALEIEVETALSSLNNSIDPIANEIFDPNEELICLEPNTEIVTDHQAHHVFEEGQDERTGSPQICDEVQPENSDTLCDEQEDKNCLQPQVCEDDGDGNEEEINRSPEPCYDDEVEMLEEHRQSPQIEEQEENSQSPTVHESAKIFYSLPSANNEINDKVSFTWINPKKDKLDKNEIYDSEKVPSTTNVVQTSNLHNTINWIRKRKERRSRPLDNEEDQVAKRQKQNVNRNIQNTPSKLSVLDQCVKDLDDIDMRLKNSKKSSIDPSECSAINDVIKNVICKSEPRKPNSTDPTKSTKRHRSSGDDINRFVVELASGWYKCNWCDFKRPKKTAVQVHLRNVHGERVSCYVCSQTFSSSKALQMHVVSVHEGLKPFECQFCGQKFPKKHSMLRHVSLVHDRSQLVACTCSICGNEYPSEDHLKTHVLHVHDTTSGPDRRKFPCKICGAVYLWRSSLQKHYQTQHLQEIQRGGNNSCSICDRRFIDEKGLRLHNLTHLKKNELIATSK